MWYLISNHFERVIKLHIKLDKYLSLYYATLNKKELAVSANMMGGICALSQSRVYPSAVQCSAVRISKFHTITNVARKLFKETPCTMTKKEKSAMQNKRVYRA